jgi:hypothetical protein
MEAENKIDDYDDAKLELAREMIAVYVEISQELGIFDFEPPTDVKILLNTPAARKLEAITIFAETGGGDSQIILDFIQSILMNLYSPRISSLADHYSIPDEFWSTMVGRLIAKALSRLHGNELLTIKEAAQMAGVSKATVSIALDTGKLTAYIDPTAKTHQRRRKVLRSEVLKRWRSKV